MYQSLCFQSVDHLLDIWLCIAFALPQVKFHIQVGIIFLKVRYRNIHNMLPDGSEWRISLLKL